MSNYFNDNNAVKFDLQNGKIETICFCRDEHIAKEIAIALNKNDNEDEHKNCVELNEYNSDTGEFWSVNQGKWISTD